MEKRITGRYSNLYVCNVFYYFRSVFVDRFEKLLHIHYGQVEYYKVIGNVYHLFKYFLVPLKNFLV